MKIAIAGCRNYINYEEAQDFIKQCLSNSIKNENLVFLSGGCKGADMLGEKFAFEHGFAIELFAAE